MPFFLQPHKSHNPKLVKKRRTPAPIQLAALASINLLVKVKPLQFHWRSNSRVLVQPTRIDLCRIRIKGERSCIAERAPSLTLGARFAHQKVNHVRQRVARFRRLPDCQRQS